MSNGALRCGRDEARSAEREQGRGGPAGRSTASGTASELINNAVMRQRHRRGTRSTQLKEYSEREGALRKATRDMFHHAEMMVGGVCEVSI